jgi:hypothetical protein
MHRPLGRPTALGDRHRSSATVSANGASARVAPEATTRRSDRQQELDRECAEVSAAILLASAGHASNVVVCNLRNGRMVARAVHGLATELGVDLELRERPRGIGADIAVHGRQGPWRTSRV